MTWTPEKIKELRKGYDETQREFRLRLGVSLNTLKYWETSSPSSSSPPLIACKLLDRLEEDLREGKIRELVSA